jgi:hypothetical protein
MSREVHVRFCEGLGVRFPQATHPNIRWRRSQRDPINADYNLRGSLVSNLRLTSGPLAAPARLPKSPISWTSTSLDSFAASMRYAKHGL